MKQRMGRLQVIEEQLRARPDQRESVTDHDAPSMARASGRYGKSNFGYDVEQDE